MAPRKEGLAPREEGRAPREKGRAGSEEGRPRLRGHRRRRRGARPGGARGRRREGASAWRVGGARSALEGRAERGGDRGQGWGSRSGARSRCRSNPNAVGLATPRVGVGPARGIGRPTRARRERRTFRRRLHHVDRPNARVWWGFARERRRDVGSALRGACPLGSHVRGRSSHGVAMRLKLAPRGRGRGDRPRADARVSLRLR